MDIVWEPQINANWRKFPIRSWALVIGFGSESLEILIGHKGPSAAFGRNQKNFYHEGHEEHEEKQEEKTEGGLEYV